MECDELLGAIEDILGSSSILVARFRQGLQNADEEAMAAAMNSLRLYENAIQSSIQDLILTWLFSHRGCDEDA